MASLGVILSAAYMLWLYRRVVFGDLENDHLKDMPDLNSSEIIILWSLAVLTVFFGFYPEPIFNTINFSVSNFIDVYNQNLITNLASK